LIFFNYKCFIWLIFMYCAELGEKLHNLKNNELKCTQTFQWLVVANRLEVCPYLVMWAYQQLSSSHDPWMNHHLNTLSMTLHRKHHNFTYLKINGVSIPATSKPTSKEWMQSL
jgi:hypothetical protein